jgi:endonuclease III
MIKTTPVDPKSLNPYASDREQIINAAVDHLKKELQTIDDENDLSYDELVYIIKRIGFYTPTNNT